MWLTIQVSIAGAKDLIGSVQSVFPGLLARVKLLDGLQKQTEAVIGEPLPAGHQTKIVDSSKEQERSSLDCCSRAAVLTAHHYGSAPCYIAVNASALCKIQSVGQAERVLLPSHLRYNFVVTRSHCECSQCANDCTAYDSQTMCIMVSMRL